MVILRNKLQGFQATIIEEERIKAVCEHLDIRKSDFLRDLTMVAVRKQERKMNRSDLEEALDTEGKKVFYNGERVR